MLVGFLCLAGFVFVTAIARRGPTPTNCRSEDARALLAIAHHDIWWAKSQAWSVTNWAILLIAGVMGAEQFFREAGSLGRTLHMAFISLALATSVMCTMYLVRLHKDMAVNRRNARKLEHHLHIDRLRTDLQIESATDPKSDWRGGVFLVLKLLTALVALFVGLLFLGGGVVATVGGAGVALLTFLYWLWVRYAAT